MEKNQWKRVKGILEQVLEMSRGDWPAFVESRCGNDLQLRQSVIALLAGDDRISGFLEPCLTSIERIGDTRAGEQYAIGQVVGQYRLIELIATGGMGSVYLAERVGDFSRKVAIKLIRSGLCNRDALRRFQRERQVLANLDHPNICRLLDGGSTPDSNPYLVMEYIDGVPIDEYCDEHSLSIDERLRLFREVCGAVQFAHRNLIVHRDLKPGNILVTPDGVPKLLDFGISKLLNDDWDHYNTVTGQHVGVMTPRFASPEQIRGASISTVSDVYSLGVILYELLTGHSPYEDFGSGRHELERCVCEQEPRRPSAVVEKAGELPRKDGNVISVAPVDIGRSRNCRPDQLSRELRGELDTVVLTALRKESERRYASVEQLSKDIQYYLEGRPILACKDSFSYRVGKLAKRNKLATLALIFALTSLVFGAVALGIGLVKARSAARDAQIEAKKVRRTVEFLQTILESADPFQKNRSITLLEVLDRISPVVGEKLADEPEVLFEIHKTLGITYRGIGEHAKSSHHLLQAIELSKTVPGFGKDKTAECMKELSLTFSFTNETESAIVLLKRAAEIYKLDSGQNVKPLADVLDFLGSLYLQAGELENSIECRREALAILRASQQADSTRLVRGLCGLATSLKVSGELVKAKLLSDEAQLIIRDDRNVATEEVLLAYRVRAGILRNRGDLEKAYEVLLRELECGRRFWRDNHPNTLYCLQRLASVAVQRGEFKSAAKHAEEALELCETNWVNPTIQNKSALISLAGTFWAVGDYSSAEEAARSAMEMAGEVSHERSPDYIVAMNTLGVILRDCGKYEEAGRLLRKTLMLTREWYGEGHSYVANAQTNLSRLLFLEGEYGDAEMLVRDALALRLKTYSPDHADVAEAKMVLGSILTETGELSLAESYLRESVKIRRGIHPDDHWLVAEAHSALGACYSAQGEYEAAEQLLLQSAIVFQKSLEQDHKLCMLTNDRIVKLYDEWGNPAKANLYRESERSGEEPGNASIGQS